MTPETERRFLQLALDRRQLTPGVLARLERARRVPSADGRRRTIARIACDAGLLSSRDARSLLREIRAPVPPAPTMKGPPDNRIAASDPRDETGVLRAGSQLAHFKIRGVLGKGGMGVVYRALDLRFNREVALKTILGEADPETVERFVREAKAAGRLKHPNVVPVFEHGVIRGVRYMALELVEGSSLAGLLREKGPLAPGDAARILRALAEGVAEAHAQGVLHRDLKPANVLLDKDGRPRLTDFGLARDERETDLTQTGDVLGTPIYMAPEQALGDKAAIGPGTDVYGLGAILYEMLTGRPPVTGRTGVEVLRRVVEDEPVRPSAVRVKLGLAAAPIDLETICLKCLEKTRERRYPRAQELADELGAFLAGDPIAARPPGRAERTRRWVRRNRAVSGATAMFVVALLLGATGWGVSSVRSSRLKREQRELELRVARGDLIAAQTSFDEASRKFRHYQFSPAYSTPARKRIPLAATALVEARKALDRRLDPEQESVSGELRATYRRVAGSLLEAGFDELACECLRRSGEPEETIAAARERARSDLEAEGAGEDRADDPLTAIALLDRIIATQPRRARAFAFRGGYRNRLGDFAGALSDLTTALELVPEPSCGLLVERSRSHYLLDDFSAAIGDCDAALELEPEFAPALTARANAKRRLGDLVGARRDIEKALKLPAVDEEHYAQLLHAELLWQTGEREKGETALDDLIARITDRAQAMPHANWFRGKMREARGDRAGAAADFRTFLSFVPNGPDADDARARLKALEAGR